MYVYLFHHIFSSSYSIVRYFTGDIDFRFSLETYFKFFIPPIICQYEVSSLELREVETYESSGIIQRLFGDYSRQYSLQLFIVFFSHLFVYVYNQYIYYTTDVFERDNIQTPRTYLAYPYLVLILSYLPYTHRYRFSALIYEVLQFIFHLHLSFKEYMHRIYNDLRMIPSIYRASKNNTDTSNTSSIFINTIVNTMAPRRVTSTPASATADASNTNDESNEATMNEQQQNMQRLMTEQAQQSQRLDGLNDEIYRIEDQLHMLHNT